MEQREAQIMAAGYKLGFKAALKMVSGFCLDRELNDQSLVDQFMKLNLVVQPIKPENREEPIA
jgi:hypothetical protein